MSPLGPPTRVSVFRRPGFPSQGDSRLWWAIGLGALGVALVVVVVGFSWWWPALERDECLEDLAPVWSLDLQSQLEQLGVWDQRRIACRAVRELQALESTGWKVQLTEVGPPSTDTREAGDRPQSVWKLDLGTAQAVGCTFELDSSKELDSSNEAEPPSHGDGQCRMLSYRPTYATGRRGPTERIDGPLTVHLQGEPVPYLDTPRRIDLDYGEQQDIRLVGMPRVDVQDVELLEGAIRVPLPAPSPRPRRAEVPLEEAISLLQPSVLRTAWAYELAPELPAGLQDIYGAERFVLLRLAGVLEVDLSSHPVSYQLEGEGTFLGDTIFHGRLVHLPGDRAVVQLHRFNPSPVVPACLSLRDSYLEMDYRQQQFRLIGGLEMNALQAFRCNPWSHAGWSWIQEQLVEGGFEVARFLADSELAVQGRAHLLIDLDDDIWCGSTSFGEKVIFQMTRHGGERRLLLEAPVSLEIDLDEQWGQRFNRIVQDRSWSELSLPRYDPRKCWSQDPGPRPLSSPTLFRD